MTTPHPGATAPQAPLDRNLLAEAAKLAYVDAHNKDSNFSAGPLAEIERYIRAAHAVGVTQGMHASPAAATQPCASAYPNQSYQCPVAEVIVSHVRPGLDGLCTAEIASAERLPVGAELFLHPPRELDHQAFVADACARIKAADDAAADNDYMLDSDDCIQVLRGEWKGPLRNDYPQKPEHPELAQAAWMASPEAAQRLGGYQELAQRLRAVEEQRDELRAALKGIIEANQSEGGPTSGLIPRPASLEHQRRVHLAWQRAHQALASSKPLELVCWTCQL